MLGDLATHTVLRLLCADGIFSSTSRPSVAIHDTPTPGRRATLARTLRYIRIRAALARTLSYINNKDIIVQNIRTTKNPVDTFTAGEDRDRFRASVAATSDHAV